MKIDLEKYQPPAHPERHFIQNDADCPLPAEGPTVTVGYWCATKAELRTGPACEGEPLFTIVYPAGRPAACYAWKHMTSDPRDPMHPNSARGIAWIDGRLRLTQFTTLDCSGPPHEKTLGWVKARDFPPELFGRILSAAGVPFDGLRENCAITLRACDGHYVGLDRAGGAAIGCDSRLAGEDCTFRLAFPGYAWSEEGGQGDQGPFALRAANGRFLARVENRDGGATLRAAAQTLAEACLFALRIERGAVASLLCDGARLCHTPPGSGLILSTDGGAPATEFTIAYR